MYIYTIYRCLYISVVLSAASKNIKHIAHIRSRRIEGWLVRCISGNNNNSNNNSWFSWVGPVPCAGTPSRNVRWFAWWFINPGSPSSSFPAHAHRVQRLIPECVSRLHDPHLGRTVDYPLVIHTYICTIYVCMCTHIGVVSDSDWVRPKANHFFFFSAKEKLATDVPSNPTSAGFPPPPRRAPS